MTGASRGIGRALALELARDGAHVVALARTQGGLEELDDEIRALGGAATLVPCDLADFDALDRLGATLFERWGKLDVLVGNAGLLGVLTPLAHVDPKEWNRVMAVNVTANWRLIRSMDPLLRRSDAGRAIFVTSGASRRIVPYWGAYATSKAALDMMVGIYAAEVAHTQVKVNLFNPGPMRTFMRREAFPGEDEAHQIPPEAHGESLIQLAIPACAMNGQWVAGDAALEQRPSIS